MSDVKVTTKRRKGIGRRVLGWLVNFYPDTVFYSDKFVPGLRIDTESGNNPHAAKGNTAMIAVAIAAGRLMKPGDTLTSTWSGVTDAGKEVGDFRITIERIDAGRAALAQGDEG